MLPPKIVAHLEKGDLILLGPRRTKAKVISKELTETIIKGKVHHGVTLEVQVERKGKWIPVSMKHFHWQDEVLMYEPKKKAIRTSILKKIAEWLRMKIKVETQ